MHSDVREFECDCCDKKFKTKTALNKHMRTHTGGFMCSVRGQRASLEFPPRFEIKGTHLSTHSVIYFGAALQQEIQNANDFSDFWAS